MANTSEYKINDWFIDEVLYKGTQMEVLLAGDLRLAKQVAAGVAPRQSEVQAIQRIAVLEKKLHGLGHHEANCKWCTLGRIAEKSE